MSVVITLSKIFFESNLLPIIIFAASKSSLEGTLPSFVIAYSVGRVRYLFENYYISYSYRNPTYARLVALTMPV